MNDLINEQDQLCTAALADILSIKIIEPDRIEYLINEYKKIYKINQFSLKENKVELGRLYNYLSDLKEYYDKLDSAKKAINDYNNIPDTSEINIIK